MKAARVKMFGYLIILCCTIMFVESYGALVSEESNDDNMSRREKNRYSVDEPERRRFDWVDDKEWHVAHLRDMDFGPRRSGCKEETFAEKVDRYRKALQNDGALVQFVSADQIPVDKKDLEVDVCRIPEAVQLFKSYSKSENDSAKHEKVKIAEGIQKEKVDKAKIIDTIANNKKGTIAEEMSEDKEETAATNDDAHSKRNKTAKETQRRAGDYMFSSIEYYDEVDDLDISSCQANVEEIILEIEHIKNYDVQCELLVEWRSLE